MLRDEPAGFVIAAHPRAIDFHSFNRKSTHDLVAALRDIFPKFIPNFPDLQTARLLKWS
jgi:hypothetical protein